MSRRSCTTVVTALTVLAAAAATVAPSAGAMPRVRMASTAPRSCADPLVVLQGPRGLGPLPAARTRAATRFAGCASAELSLSVPAVMLRLR